MKILNRYTRTVLLDVPGETLQNADLRGADLRGADLQGADLRDAHLRGADLQGADLRDAHLRGADLRGAYLRGADLRGAYLRGADLRDAHIRDAHLQGADIRNADLQNADLRGAILPTEESWEEYLSDVVPALCAAGGKTLAEVGDAWDCHCWENCPMAVAFDCHGISGVPVLYRPRAKQFIQFFDAGLLSKPC